MKPLLLVLIAIAVAGPASHVLAGPCSEGPTPLKLHDLSPDFKPLEGRIGAQDFNFWEETGKLVFRTYANQLQAYSLTSGLYTSLTPMPRSMATLTEPQNRYVVTEGANIVFDSQTDSWVEFTGAQQPLRHLFWNGDDLYTLDRTVDAQGKHRLRVFEYRFGNEAAREICSLDLRDRTEIAEGFHYPNFRMYRVDVGLFGKQYLNTWRVDVSQGCRVTQEDPIDDYYPGRLKRVYNFDQDLSLGVEVEGSSTNFMWIRKHSCTPFALSGTNPFIGDFKKPLVANYTAGKGLELVDLETRQVSYLIQDWQVREFTSRDMRMSSDRETLFLSPLREGESQRKLVQVSLTP